MRKADRTLSPAELEQFGAEIEAIRQKHLADVGERDAKYITKIEKAVRYTEIAGRGLLMAGIFPPAFVLGTLTLGVSKILENMELGHNVMHGQYDFMQNKRLMGQTYEWDTWCTSDNWRYSHNYRHHTFTNVLGEDHDIGYGVLRLFPEQKWEPRFLANIPMMALLATFFENLLALQTLELEKVISGEKTLKETKDRAIPTLKKAWRQIAKDYIFFPLLAGPFLLPVLAGNFLANIIRNYWTFTIIFCGHFTADSEVFDKSVVDGESQAHWYLRQLKGSSNLTGGKLFHIMSGNLSHQIEHHLFPEVPAHRYAEMSVEVQEICKRYGQHYNKASIVKQFSTVVGRAFKYSLPSLKRKSQEALAV
ncbi:acyl-CoA desaturase [Limnobacter humi]|uniref:Acyl-CoA desaturase n=1 Tax=Limnobacter humi TaxID=1778671 RepID=A0ABT1WBW4_9BURK|nr:acyl-CoA desaturase [Limnobacter humi]MCQ8895003.1 acyl-CoA desaturase [Limnobacter humi]